MSKTTYKYEIENDGERYEFDHNGASDWETGRVWIAEAAAEDFFHNHDGWEASWPIEFSIFEAGDKFLGTFSVDCKAVPQFLAHRIAGAA